MLSEATSTADRRLQRYKLLEEVGQGAMAVVYRGIDTSLDREVAVKILHAHLANEQESRDRFQREAQAVAKLRHDNILEIYDYSGTSSDQSYIVTEFIHGITLKAFLARNTISHPEIAAMIVCEVCAALDHAHSLSVIHRDIKPENIMIRRDGRVKLTDFGIAQMVDLRKLTVTGQLLGSPAYMAPELVQGRPVDFRADVFSVGTLLYQLATGVLPFQGKNPHEILKRIADGRYAAPEQANATVSADLGTIIRKALARDPDQRYARIADLAGDLRRFLADAGIDDVRGQLTEYFANPASYGRSLQTRVVEALVSRSRQALQSRHKAVALRYLDRVLCIDPGNAEVRAALARLTRQRRWVQVGIGAAIVALAGVGVYATVDSWRERTESNHIGVTSGLERAIAAAASAFDGGMAPGPAGSAGRDAAAASDSRGGRERTSALRRHGMRRRRHSRLLNRRVEIVPTPKAITIWLNGRRLGAYGPDLRFVDLPTGPVQLTFRNDDCCFRRVVVIDGRDDPKQLRVRLPWKPGRVRVRVQPRVPADIAVGSVVARAGQTVEVPIPAYAASGRTEVQVRVSVQGYATESRTVTVRANATTDFSVRLRPAP